MSYASSDYMKAKEAYAVVMNAVKSGTDNPTHTLSVAALVNMVGADAVGAMIDNGFIREGGCYAETGMRFCIIW